MTTSENLDQEILRFIHCFQKADEAPEKDFEALALKIFSYQYKTNHFYRRFCDIEGKNPFCVRHWKEIPAMPAEGFKEFFLTTFSVKKATRFFRTSGTTQGTSGPSHSAGRGVHFFETLKLYEAALVPAFKKYLLPDRTHMKMFFLTASPAELRDSSLSYMMGVVRRRFGVTREGGFYVKKGKVLSEKLARDLLASKTPVMILATAFSLKSFLDYLAEHAMRLKLRPGSRLMETGGFKGRANEVSKKVLYRECRTRLGLGAAFCVSEYGMTELSSQYYDTTLYDKVRRIRRRPFKAPPAWMRTLVVDPVTGKEAAIGGRGILRHYDLANRGSVMAVQTEDLGIRRRSGFEFYGRAPKASLRGCSLTYEEFLKG